MGGINVFRWILSGIVSGTLFFLIEGLASQFYHRQMEASLQRLGLSMEMSAQTMLWALLVSLIAGLSLVFFYAAARPRFGPGPRTAFIVATALFCGGYLLSLIGYHMMGMFPLRLLIHWGLVGYLETVLVTIVGAWIYREE
ncbi:MAG: hypothetical protein ACE5HV_16445 [Acidobacteriota bacterium]